MRPGTVPTTTTTPPVVQNIPSSIAPTCAWADAPAPERAPAPRDLLTLDRTAMTIRTVLDRITVPVARACAVLARERLFTRFGYARLDDFARERLQRSGRWVRDHAALAAATDRLPPLALALTGEDGDEPLGMVAALLIARVADAQSLPGWLARARSCTVRELRVAVAQAVASAGAPPDGDAAGGRDAGCASIDPEPDLVAARLPVPEPVRRAFDEAVDLFRAVEGRESGIVDFVDALCAEAGAGSAPFEVESSPVRHGPTAATLETAMAHATARWRDLRATNRGEPDEPGGGTARFRDLPGPDSIAGTRTLLAAAHGLAREASADPAAVLRRLSGLLGLAAELERGLGEVLADLAARGGWARLLFADAGHYAEERLRLSRTVATDRARLARALRCRPLLRAAVSEGRLGCEAALLVLRALGPEPGDLAAEEAWVASAATLSVKRLRDEVRAIRAGAGSVRAGADAAGAATHPTTHPMTHPMTDVATGRHSVHPLDDETWHATLRREPGRSRRRVLRAGLEALGAFDPAAPLVDPDVFHPDGTALPAGPDVFLRLRLPRSSATRFVAAIEAARAARAGEAGAVPWDEPFDRRGALPSLMAARMYTARGRRVPAWVGLLALLEDFVFTWDPVEVAAPRAADATYIRDGWRCAAPGCTSRRNLEEHHVVYRSRGGGDDPANLVTLCRFHHQLGEHDRLARVRGAAPLGLVWRLGRADLGTWYRNERRVPAPREVD